jgi:hypothetical protein
MVEFRPWKYAFESVHVEILVVRRLLRLGLYQGKVAPQQRPTFYRYPHLPIDSTVFDVDSFSVAIPDVASAVLYYLYSHPPETIRQSRASQVLAPSHTDADWHGSPVVGAAS